MLVVDLAEPVSIPTYFGYMARAEWWSTASGDHVAVVVVIGRQREKRGVGGHWQGILVCCFSCEPLHLRQRSLKRRTMHVAVSTRASIKRVLVLGCAPGTGSAIVTALAREGLRSAR